MKPNIIRLMLTLMTVAIAVATTVSEHILAVGPNQTNELVRHVLETS